MRQTRSGAEAISTALKERSSKVGSEATYKTDPKLFADNRQLQRLDSPSWQIVFGRRGLGKTILLATYAKYITTDNRNKVASIELNAQDFISIVQSNSNKKPTAMVIAQNYFANFMRCVADHLFQVFSERNSDSKFWRFSENFRNQQKRKFIEDLVVKIKQSTMEQMPSEIGRVDHTHRDSTTAEHSKNEMTGSIGGGIGLDISVPNFDVNAKGNIAVENAINMDETTTKSSDLDNYIFNYWSTRKLIEELLDVLGFVKLYLFIDEWSELDRTASTNIQPLFAELLKRVFSKNEKFVVKIGAIRNQTRLQASGKTTGPIGLELSADIFELNLDGIFSRNELSKTEFFEQLIFRHLLFVNPALSGFQGNAEETQYGTYEGRPSETFIEHIFREEGVFGTLISGAGSVPRDFIEIFDEIARRRNFSVMPPWTHTEITQAIKDHYIEHKHKEIDSDDSLQDLLDKITLKIRNNKNRLIAVSKKSQKHHLNSFAKLYHRRIIHDVATADVPAMLRNKFHFYFADLGHFLDVHNGNHELIDLIEDRFPLNGNENADDIAIFLIEDK